MFVQQNSVNNNLFIVDVRTPEEFASGHAEGAINIPFSLLPLKIEELRQMQGELILCCASGARSRAAARMLHQSGIDCKDVGSWLNVCSTAGGTLAC